MLVDTHCHLGSEQFDDDRAGVLDRARDAGVTHVVVIAESRDATQRALELAKQFHLTSSAGVHPHDASSWSPEVARYIEDTLDNEEVVAVGETGLDYHYDHSPHEVQRRAFEDHLALGVRYQMPVVVHSRSADDDMAAMLRDSDANVILHSFSSGDNVLEAGLARDAYVSFSGMVTFKSWSNIEAIRAVPVDRLLVETDAPYLAPVPYRGKRNEPAFVAKVAERVADVRGMTLDELIHTTTANAVRCFGDRVTQTTITQ